MAMSVTAEQQLTHRRMINIVPLKEAIEPSHTLSFLRDPHFVGRLNVMEELEAKFGLHDSSSRVALVGLGGMG